MLSTNYKQVTSFLFLFLFFILYGNHIIPFVSTKKEKEKRSYSIYILKPLCYIYVVYNFFEDGECPLCLTLPKEERIALFSNFFS